MGEKIDILLPVYNGEKYLKEQIESLFYQTYRDIRIIIRDDGSTDGSTEVLKAYGTDPRVQIVNDNKGNLGSTKCFEELIKYVSAEYFMFCDQDDIWKPDKVENTLREIQNKEKMFPSTPLLICTDASCIDSDGNMIAESFFASQRFEETLDSKEKMAALNIVQGNTCLMNNLCKNFLHDIPEDIVYDCWVALVIAYYGKVFYMHNQTVLYRQHANNVVGSKKIGLHYFAAKFFQYRAWYRKNYVLWHSLPYKLNICKCYFWKIYFTLKRI